ncbi:MAG: aminodeoxyfutalosine deaminase [Micromonosporaceae bacterium]
MDPMVKQRWKSVLLLTVLALVLAEVISGGTPITQMFLPWILVFYVVFLYGFQVLVIREVAVRGRLGLLGLCCLGTVYGLYNEGLRAQALFYPLRSAIDTFSDHGIVAEVCPTSNVRTRVVAEMSAHPVRAMLAVGLTVTVNTDDPPMFGTDLTNECLCVAGLAGLDRPGAAELAANAVRASFLDPSAKAALLADISDAVRTAGTGSAVQTGPPDEVGPAGAVRW